MSRSGRVCHLQKMTGIAGSENFLLQLGRGLTERGWDCHFGLVEESSTPVDRAAEQLRRAGWTVERFPYSSLEFPGLVPAIRNWIRAVDPSLVHTHLLHADLLGGLATLGLERPVLTTKHNDDRYKHAPGYGWGAKLLNRCFDQGIAISHHLESFYRNQLGVSTLAWETIHYGLDPEPFRKASPPSRDGDRITFGIVARLTEQKGHSTLLEAFGDVTEKQDQVELRIIGDGPLRESLEQTARKLGLEDFVHFEGYREDVPAVLGGLDVFVHPSRWEGFGLVFLEAMSSKLPVIGTNVSAIPEIVLDGETGLLVEPDQPDQLAEAMLELARDGDRRGSFGEAGYRRVVEEFSPSSMVEAHEQLYRRILSSDQ